MDIGPYSETQQTEKLAVVPTSLHIDSNLVEELEGLIVAELLSFAEDVSRPGLRAGGIYISCSTLQEIEWLKNVLSKFTLKGEAESGGSQGYCEGDKGTERKCTGHRDTRLPSRLPEVLGLCPVHFLSGS